MDSDLPEHALPPEILQRASRAGNEYAWCVQDIPDVIEAARLSNLISIGGQLQFRLPDGGTCECYWVEVDTYKSVDKALPWQERVTRTAEAALRDFQALQRRVDFIAEGRVLFARHLDALVAQGRDPADSMYFVSYVMSEADAKSPGPANLRSRRIAAIHGRLLGRASISGSGRDGHNNHEEEPLEGRTSRLPLPTHRRSDRGAR